MEPAGNGLKTVPERRGAEKRRLEDGKRPQTGLNPRKGFSLTLLPLLLQPGLCQLYRTMRISSSTHYVALLAVYGPPGYCREVDVRPAVRQLVVDHDSAGSSESFRGRHATGCRRPRTGRRGQRSCNRRTLQESIARSHSEKHPVRRAVVKLSQRRTLIPFRVVYLKGGTRWGAIVKLLGGKGKHVHLWLRRCASVVHESARDHVPGGL